MATKYLFLQGKRAVVTGAGKGIGHGIVEGLARNGAKVTAISRSKANLEKLRDAFPDAVDEIVSVDLSDVKAIKESLKDIKTPHMVVNNAGITNLEPFLETEPESFDAVLDVNVRAAMLVSQIAAKRMIEEDIKGSIVNISSMGAEIGLDMHTSYCTSKGAINQLTRVMALELGKYGIRTNCVQPTIVYTEMGKLAWSDPVKSQPMLDRIPLGKFCEVEDVVNPVLFLLSNDAAMINGAMIPIEGGFLASPFNKH
mmetsp:Transcript_3459/g.8148  ORF Transcript_3459/g.8148 Transcript_3459/m.8148 type:complete len:255 (-) Transcript_3459:141-905(-)|eukprot:CAMPEP_0114500126 /NCGR_PEP_ID=MMETSP0109-20121206/7792_1 /TAXON_ID=29199 /ORGANISM="Chlorarachnion reptans, Strain CCCM449" /LENGTH=254 /DNA_ID=CAMNT_0001677755 /DNA_START=51 /DNA_END=815 /DNA_ORIENTATION=+